MQADPLHVLARLVRERAGDAPAPVMEECGDWYQLSAAEAEVFDIDPGVFPVMVETYHCFEAITGNASRTDYDTQHEAMLNAVRAARPDLVESFGMDEFLGFAHALGLLTMRQATQMFWKMQAGELRSWVLDFADGS